MDTTWRQNMKLLIFFNLWAHLEQSSWCIYIYSYIKHFGENTNFSRRRNNCCVRMSLPTWLHCQTLNHSMDIIGYSSDPEHETSRYLDLIQLDTTCRFFWIIVKIQNRRNQFSLCIKGVLSPKGYQKFVPTTKKVSTSPVSVASSG